MFVGTSAANLAALRSELQTDPAALGYGPLLQSGAHSDLAVRLNATRASAADVWVDEVESYRLRSRVKQSDWTALSAAQQGFVNFMLGGASVDFTVTQVRTDLGALFPANSATRTAWLAVAQRKPTRAEELFGIGSLITAGEVGAALG